MKTTDKFMILTTESGRRYAFPCHVIAHFRSSYYAGRGDSYEEEYEYTANDASELFDWAQSNMNWDDVEHYAVELPRIEQAEDLQEQWIMGNMSSPLTPQAIGDTAICEKLYYALQECEKKEKYDAI